MDVSFSLINQVNGDGEMSPCLHQASMYPRGSGPVCKGKGFDEDWVYCLVGTGRVFWSSRRILGVQPFPPTGIGSYGLEGWQRPLG